MKLSETEFLELAESGDVIAQRNLGYMYGTGTRVKQDYDKAFYWSMKAAEQGDPQAQSNLGLLYYNGYGVEKDYTKSFEWYLEAAKKGNLIARYNVGLAYEYGLGIEKNIEEAAHCYAGLAMVGDVRSQYKLGCFHLEGLGGLYKCPVTGFTWLKKAAESGHDDAQYRVAECYYEGVGVEPDHQQAFEWFSKAAEQDQEDAVYSFGLLYYQDNLHDYESAFKCYERAAELGLAKAQHKLASCYEKGEGVVQDVLKAIEWYMNAAEQDYDDSMVRLGAIYEGGKGVEADVKLAYKWYDKAAKAGNVDALFWLGRCFYSGKYVGQDYQKARDLFLLAAEKGDCRSQSFLGNMYIDGLGVEQDYKKAYSLHKTAADSGAFFAYWNVGRMYEKGLGVSQDFYKAAEWYIKAAKSGDEDGIKALTNLRNNGLIQLEKLILNDDTFGELVLTHKEVKDSLYTDDSELVVYGLIDLEKTNSDYIVDLGYVWKNNRKIAFGGVERYLSVELEVADDKPTETQYKAFRHFMERKDEFYVAMCIKAKRVFTQANWKHKNSIIPESLYIDHDGNYGLLCKLAWNDKPLSVILSDGDIKFAEKYAVYKYAKILANRSKLNWYSGDKVYVELFGVMRELLVFGAKDFRTGLSDLENELLSWLINTNIDSYGPKVVDYCNRRYENYSFKRITESDLGEELHFHNIFFYENQSSNEKSPDFSIVGTCNCPPSDIGISLNFKNKEFWSVDDDLLDFESEE